MKNVSIIISLLIFAVGCGVASKGEDRLYTKKYVEVVFPWSKDRSLNWDDFKGSIPMLKEERHEGAEQMYHIAIAPKTVGGKTKYLVINFFLEKHSWVSRPTKLLLEHEQIHFDITELITRQLRYSLDSLSNLSNSKINYNDVIGHHENQLNELQSQFDIETRQGRNSVKQSKWKFTIDRKLSLIDSLYIEY